MNRLLRGTTDTRRAIAAAAGMTVILGLAACGGGGGSGNGPGPTDLHLVIGNSLPLSGSSKALGDSGRKASQLALGKIKGAAASVDANHTVRIVNEDQGSDADTAVASATRLVHSDGASCLTGPWSSEAVARTAQEVTIPGKVLQISPVATGDDVADLDDHDLVDSTALPVSAEGDAIAKAIEQALGGIEGNTVNVAANADPNSETVSQDFIQAWQDGNGTVGGPTTLPPPPSRLPQITANGPDGVLLVDDPAAFAQLARSLSSSDEWDPATVWANDQLVSPGLPAEVGPDVIQGMRALAPGSPTGSESASAFTEDFKSASPHSVKAAPFAAQQFDATILCYLAAVAAGSTDGQKMADTLIDITAPGGTEYSWQQLPDAIRALEDGKDINYSGASGPVDMDVHGNPTNGVFALYQYASGALREVGEVPVEQPNPATP